MTIICSVTNIYLNFIVSINDLFFYKSPKKLLKSKERTPGGRTQAKLQERKFKKGRRNTITKGG
jgi:hypothetical protein